MKRKIYSMGEIKKIYICTYNKTRNISQKSASSLLTIRLVVQAPVMHPPVC